MNKRDNSQTPSEFAPALLQTPNGMLFGDSSAALGAGWLLGDDVGFAQTLMRC
jgi:hypothetical protein